MTVIIYTHNGSIHDTESIQYNTSVALCGITILKRVYFTEKKTISYIYVIFNIFHFVYLQLL